MTETTEHTRRKQPAKVEKVQLSKESLYELQRLDCNCNECFFLERDLEQATTQKGKASPVYAGTCKKFEKEITFQPGICQLDTQQCFLHRKDAKPEL